jgi:hypothetical protein
MRDGMQGDGETRGDQVICWFSSPHLQPKRGVGRDNLQLLEVTLKAGRADAVRKLGF